MRNMIQSVGADKANQVVHDTTDDPRREAASGMPIAAAATLACVYEATAAKPGNVHPHASFPDTTYTDFVKSAVVIGPILEQATSRGVGRTILDAVSATRQAVGTNTNLGTLLLMVPLAAVPAEHALRPGIAQLLRQFTVEDTRLVYEAIRQAGAGGLGRTDQADVHAEPPPELTLLEAMRLAADRDLVARQYTNGFAEVFQTASWIKESCCRWPFSVAIVHAHVRLLAAYPDSLILRKCGQAIAEQASLLAAEVLRSGSPGESRYALALDKLDGWLREDGNRRNPGTSADLVAAGLFVLLREGRLDWNTVKWE